MYSAFWLWAIAQALLLPNWIAGFAGLAGFGVLYFGRVAREERMMLETFWRQLSRVYGEDWPRLPVCTLKVLADLGSVRPQSDRDPKASNSVPFSQHLTKNDCRDR